MYKLSQNATKWEREMFFRAKNIERQYPCDIWRLYIELEKIAKKYLATKEMNNGDSFLIPIKDGTTLNFAFYGNETAIIRTNINHTQDKLIIPKDKYEKEKRFS